MSIRNELNQKKRKASIPAYIGFTIIFINLVIGGDSSPRLILVIIGFILFFGGVLYSFLKIRCPKCKRKLGYIIIYDGNPFHLSKEFKYCPFCGIDIDLDHNINMQGV